MPLNGNRKPHGGKNYNASWHIFFVILYEHYVYNKHWGLFIVDWLRVQKAQKPAFHFTSIIFFLLQIIVSSMRSDQIPAVSRGFSY